MRKSLFVVSLCAVLSAPLWYANSGIASDSGSESATQGEVMATLSHGDSEAGKAASAVCAGCHGLDGIATITTYPNLAGQGAPYMVKQLMEFKSGARENAIMLGMVAALDEPAMNNLAAFYAQLPPAEGISTSDNLELGRDIYRGGITGLGVPACMGCHGPDGAGNDAAKFPRLAGQNADYIKVALEGFRSGARANDVNKMMQSVAHRLSDIEIAALANYVQGLH